MTANPAGGHFSMMEHRSVGVLYFMAGIFGFLGNLLIVLIFLRDKPLSGSRSRLHINFAICNMMIVAGTPFSGSSAFAGRWLFGETGCQLYGLETYIGGMGAVTFACLLCIESFYYAASSDNNTSSAMDILYILGWIYNIGIAVAPLFGWNSYVIESSGTACGLDWQSDDYSHRSYFVVINVIFVIMVFAAVLGLRSAFKAPQTGKHNEEETMDWFTGHQLNWIALANLSIVLIGFGPYGYFGMWALFNHTANMTALASVIPPLSAKMSTCFFPIVYMVASRKFRNAYAAKTLGGCDEKKTN